MDKIAFMVAVYTLNESPKFLKMLGGIPIGHEVEEITRQIWQTIERIH